MAKAETEAPLRVGAKAKKLLSSIDKPQAQVEKAVKKAESLARENGDRMLRDYYLYQALGMEMPSKVKEDWEYFRTNGKERPGASAGDGEAAPKRPATKKAGASNPPPKRGAGSFKPDPKPSPKRSGGQSKQKGQKSSTAAQSSESTTSNGKSSEGGSLPSSTDVLEI